MSTDLHRTIAAIGEGFARVKPVEPPARARLKAREIIDANVGYTLIEITAPLAPEPVAEDVVTRTAREIRASQVAEECGSFLNPRTGAETAYYKGYIDGMRAARHIYAPLIEQGGASEYDRFCQKCGKRDGSVFLTEPPADGFVRSVCFDCSAGDEPRAA